VTNHLENSEKFNDFINKTKDSPPHEILIKALEFITPFNDVRFAIDLGCGGGRDTLLLLNQGWHVLAIDQNPTAEKVIEEQIESNADKLIFLCSSFENLDFTSHHPVDLINAGYSLPFCNPNNFPKLWEIITNQLKIDGIFSGHFFGNRHSWANNSLLNFHTLEDLNLLFSHFNILYFREEETEGYDIFKNDVHWHVFHVVIQKKDEVKERSYCSF
jgi:SAM-dependent methyltransferase